MIYLFRSSDFADTFEDNTASRFKTRLLQRVAFDSGTNMTLLHIRVPPLATPTLAYIYTSCTDVVQVGSRGRRLLQVVPLEKSDSTESYNITPPVPRLLACSQLEEIKFTLRGETDSIIEFGAGATTLVLQIQ